jgi:predicted secreted hydrolase
MIALLGWVLVVSGLTGQAAEAPTWRQAAPGYRWSLPRDLYAHPEYKTEWWYITGHLQTIDTEVPTELAFQLTFFRVGLQPDQPDTSGSAWRTSDLIMAHAAVTDPSGKGHTFSEVIWRATPFLGGFGAPGDTTLAWCRAPAGTDDRWSLAYQDGVFRLQVHDVRQGLRYALECTPQQPPVFHGEDGFSPKSADGSAASLYFSQTRMEVSGTVDRDGRPVAVRGQSWLDREIFTSTLGSGQQGWDWLALQLDDGRELMLYRLLTPDGAVDFALGTLIEQDGTTTKLPADQWHWQAREYWTSPRTTSRYPIAWTLSVPDLQLELELEAVLPDQENVSPRTGIHYWEGAVKARLKNGKAGVGRGFVELTGYGEGSRPPV